MTKLIPFSYIKDEDFTILKKNYKITKVENGSADENGFKDFNIIFKSKNKVKPYVKGHTLNDFERKRKYWWGSWYVEYTPVKLTGIESVDDAKNLFGIPTEKNKDICMTFANQEYENYKCGIIVDVSKQTVEYTPLGHIGTDYVDNIMNKPHATLQKNKSNVTISVNKGKYTEIFVIRKEVYDRYKALKKRSKIKSILNCDEKDITLNKLGEVLIDETFFKGKNLNEILNLVNKNNLSFKVKYGTSETDFRVYKMEIERQQDVEKRKNKKITNIVNNVINQSNEANNTLKGNLTNQQIAAAEKLKERIKQRTAADKRKRGGKLYEGVCIKF